ncbi:unnamed protein product, partial [Polarella glacialis]
AMRWRPWPCARLSIVLLTSWSAADPLLFADLSDEDLVPRNLTECLEAKISDCRLEHHSGFFEWTQVYRSFEHQEEALSTRKRFQRC